MAKLPKLPTRREAAKARLKRMTEKAQASGGDEAVITKRARAGRNKRMGRAFGRRLLKSYGMSGKMFGEKSAVHRMGLFGTAMQRGAVSDPTSSDVNVPAADTPTKESYKNNPSLSTIIDQLNNLARTANRIGAITKEQQVNITNQIKQAKRAGKEQSMEDKGGAVQPEGPDGTGASLAPLNDVVDDLVKQLSELLGVVKQKNKEQEEEGGPKGFRQRLAESFGAGDAYKKRKEAKAAKLAKGAEYGGWTSKQGVKNIGGPEKALLEAEGFKVTEKGVRYPPGTIIDGKKVGGQFAKGKDVEQILRGYHGQGLDDAAKAASKPGIFKRAGAGIAGGVSKATGAIKSGFTKVAQSGAVTSAKGGISKATSAITGAIGSGFKKVGSSKAVGGAIDASEALIKKIAGPIVKSTVPKMFTKAIPVLGGLMGAFEAGKRLIKGDVVGAGLEGISGIGSMATALPAAVLSIARDTYKGAFGVQPEADPNVGPRLGMVKTVVGAMVAAAVAKYLGKKKEDGKGKGTAAPEKKEAAAPAAPPKAPTEKKDKVAAPPPAAMAPKPAAPPAAPPGGVSPTQPSSSESATPKPIADQAPVSVPSLTATPEKPMTGTGKAIAEASTSNAAMNASGQVQPTFPGTSVPKPDFNPTSKAAAKGMGNVPEVNYAFAGDVLDQAIFFGAAA